MRGQLLKVISRAEQLAWRERWKNGRWVKLSWTSDERSAILRQDEAYRQADAKWQLHHGPVPGGASILPFGATHTQINAALFNLLAHTCKPLE